MAIILTTGRPALPVENSTFGAFPPPFERFEERRSSLENAARQVGLLAVEGHPYASEAGTCFLVAPDIVMTARHAIEMVANVRSPLDIAMRKELAVRVRFPGLAESESPLVSAVPFVHPVLNCGVLRLDWRETRDVASRVGWGLRLAAHRPERPYRTDVATIGYCTEDAHADPQLQKRIFSAGFGKLYLSPGWVTGSFPGRLDFSHDCSMHGGGAPVIEAETGDVLGVHVAGSYLDSNFAVPSWLLAGDRPVRDAGVAFADDPSWIHLWRARVEREPAPVRPAPVSTFTRVNTPAPTPQGPLLRGEELTDVHQLLLDSGLVEPASFRALFAGLDTAIVALLPVEGSAAARALNVLDSLNRMEQVQDGTWPILLFLRTAAHLTQALKEGEQLGKIVERLQGIVDRLKKAEKKVPAET